MSSQYCFVVEDAEGICGYVLGTPDAKEFHAKMEVAWLPEMRNKYPPPIETDNLTHAQVTPGIAGQLNNRAFGWEPWQTWVQIPVIVGSIGRVTAPLSM